LINKNRLAPHAAFQVEKMMPESLRPARETQGAISPDTYRYTASI